MVVSGSEHATRAGAEILGSGGNAVDAAVATAFALAVTEPTQSGLGGRTQALVWNPDGTVFGVDATTTVPRSYDPDTAETVDDGYGVIGIPGTVAGLARVLEEGGSMSLPEVLAPAIRLAEGGFPLSEGEAGRLAAIRERLLLSAGARSVFLKPDSSAYASGEVLRQPFLADVLRTLSEEGPEAFYRGSIARRIAADMGAAGAYLTAADLHDYAARPSIVVNGAFGTSDLVGTYIPASGATTIETLQILDRLALDTMSVETRTVAIGQALLMAFEDRDTAWNDARPPEEDAAWITSEALADERAGELPESMAPAVPLPEPNESAHTTHLSVVDGSGVAVAMTQSLGPTGGSRVATPGLGFLYAATVGGYLGRVEPGDRPWSSQSPLIAFREGRPAYVMGGAGSRRIISALVQTLVRIEVEGLDVEAALGALRFHPSTAEWVFERRTASDPEPPGVASVRRLGYDVRVEPSGTFFARLNVIALDRDGLRGTGVADPRWPWGAASGPIRR
jgi:gamma-glutamyltranspeptidase/glutathione hydrolase